MVYYAFMNLPALWLELKQYPAGVIEELHKIQWPTWERTRNLTIVVIAVVAVATAIVGLMDVVFYELVARLMA